LKLALTEQLAHLIRAQGPLPFDTFMETALYHPEEGYYSSGQTRTGRTGDFLTPVSPGPVLGQLLARQADELHEALRRPKRIRLIEQGAEAGWLARDLWASIRQNHPELAGAAQLHLIEPHPRWMDQQKQALRETDSSAQWHPGWQKLPAQDSPCFFYSCELVDSFPVRIFKYRKKKWREQLVGLGPSGFQWHEKEADPASLVEIQKQDLPTVEGFTLELRPSLRRWLESWAEKIPAGLVLTMDYGFRSAELLSPRHPAGTLVALRDHQRSPDPLTDPGQQDLTAHVNFTELEELADRTGWKNYGLVDFAHGLTSLASPLLESNHPFSETWIRNFRHLTHPSFFGHTHKILVQGKSLPPSFTPSILMKV